jgi:small-conductance mechanosensitive channel
LLEQLAGLIDYEHILTNVVEFLPSLVAAIFMLFVFFLVYRLTRPPLRAALNRTSLHGKLVELLVDNLYKYAIMVVGLVMALDQLGVNVGAAVASIGVAGIAIGFAAQDSLSNTIAGLMIFWDEPFRVGSWIRVESQWGQVSDITLRTTRIRTKQNTWVIIPNKNIIDTVIENFSKHGETRVDVPLGIAYKEDVAAARKVLLGVVAGMEGIREDPAPEVVVVELGDSSVNLEVRVWIDDAGKSPPVTTVVLEKGKAALDEAGIEIPFPHLQLFFDDVRPPVWKGLDRLVGAGGGNGNGRG